jgi:glyoxylase-like metal-dependent hydrolase (beta-lactamase superfamily II)
LALTAASWITIGDVRVGCLRELTLDVPVAPPASLTEEGHPDLAWVDRGSCDFEHGRHHVAIQTFVVWSEGKVILVDTGVGNHKPRPLAPFDQLDTDYLVRLERDLGVHPEEVDVVVLTHAHTDHIGWNTTLRDDRWVPTFPNARHLLDARDWNYWNPANQTDTTPVRAEINEHCFEDSLEPVFDAGLIELVEPGYEIDGSLRLADAHGHTPGQLALIATSGDEHAAFVGDVSNCPLQLAAPDWSSYTDEDPAQAAETRRKLLDWCVDRRALWLPAHYPGPVGGRIGKRDGDYIVEEWTDFVA